MVMMTSLIIVIISLGILTQSVNQLNIGQNQIDQIACDQLVKGTMWPQMSSGLAASNAPVQLGFKSYQVVSTSAATATPGVSTLTVTCTSN